MVRLSYIRGDVVKARYTLSVMCVATWCYLDSPDSFGELFFVLQLHEEE